MSLEERKRKLRSVQMKKLRGETRRERENETAIEKEK